MERAALLTTLLIVAAATVAAPASSDRQAAAGTLELKVTLSMISNPFPCPAGVPFGANECRARTGNPDRSGASGSSPRPTPGPWAWARRPVSPTSPRRSPTTGRILVHGKGSD